MLHFIDIFSCFDLGFGGYVKSMEICFLFSLDFGEETVVDTFRGVHLFEIGEFWFGY